MQREAQHQDHEQAHRQRHGKAPQRIADDDDRRKPRTRADAPPARRRSPRRPRPPPPAESQIAVIFGRLCSCRVNIRKGMMRPQASDMATSTSPERLGDHKRPRAPKPTPKTMKPLAMVASPIGMQPKTSRPRDARKCAARRRRKRSSAGIKRAEQAKQPDIEQPKPLRGLMQGLLRRRRERKLVQRQCQPARAHRRGEPVGSELPHHLAQANSAAPRGLGPSASPGSKRAVRHYKSPSISGAVIARRNNLITH